jgi:hypothetical protein
MNYARIINPGTREVLGYIATEPGTPNEQILIDKALDMGLKLEAATEEEYNACDPDEFTEVSNTNEGPQPWIMSINLN